MTWSSIRLFAERGSVCIGELEARIDGMQLLPANDSSAAFDNFYLHGLNLSREIPDHDARERHEQLCIQPLPRHRFGSWIVRVVSRFLVDAF